MSNFHYVLFSDVAGAKALYDILKAKKIKCTFAPTPREADKCCGVCVLYYNENDRNLIEDLIMENNIKFLKFYDGETVDPARMKFS
ncbi:MAG: DUF3343 domain-containing protein [Synergistaceae bacterium]|nr:DUF3343 domain-containing protein [Synergistaceae bacterium]